jgi:tetratricopeptide (TPR) repeat protein
MAFVHRFAIVLVLGAAVPAAAQIESSARAAEARGDSLMAAFDTVQAIAAYRSGLETNPEDVGLMIALARALTNLAEETPGKEGDEARYEEAVGMSSHAVRLAPDVSRTHSTLAAALGRHALFQGGKRKVELGREVYREAQRAIALDGNDYRPFIVLGAWHREVATLNPILKGIANTFLGGLPKASLEQSAAALERARRLEPGIIFTHLELARTFDEMDREDAALREIERALELPPREQLDRVLKEQARQFRDEIS